MVLVISSMVVTEPGANVLVIESTTIPVELGGAIKRLEDVAETAVSPFAIDELAIEDTLTADGEMEKVLAAVVRGNELSVNEIDAASAVVLLAYGTVDRDGVFGGADEGLREIVLDSQNVVQLVEELSRTGMPEEAVAPAAATSELLAVLLRDMIALKPPRVLVP